MASWNPSCSNFVSSLDLPPCTAEQIGCRYNTVLNIHKQIKAVRTSLKISIFPNGLKIVQGFSTYYSVQKT